MTLMEIIRACGARISGGTAHQWQCYGNDARYIDFADVDGLEYASIVHDTRTYRVYQIDLHIPGQEQAFRWNDPEFRGSYEKECKQRELEADVAWDDVIYQLVDEETIIRYAEDIGATYYDNLPVPN